MEFAENGEIHGGRREHFTKASSGRDVIERWESHKTRNEGGTLRGEMTRRPEMKGESGGRNSRRPDYAWCR